MISKLLDEPYWEELEGYLRHKSPLPPKVSLILSIIPYIDYPYSQGKEPTPSDFLMMKNFLVNEVKIYFEALMDLAKYYPLIYEESLTYKETLYQTVRLENNLEVTFDKCFKFEQFLRNETDRTKTIALIKSIL